MWPGLYWLTLDTFYEVHTSRLHIYPSLKFSVFFVWQSASIVANSFGGHSTNSIARYKRPLRIEFHLLSPNLGPTCQGFPFLPHSSALPHRKLTTPCSALRPPGCLAAWLHGALHTPCRCCPSWGLSQAPISRLHLQSGPLGRNEGK